MSDLITLMAGAAGAGGAAETDEYFNQTTLLLHGDGTNGAQNNTFLDSSTNNFTITRNGNTTQGTFSPFSNADGEWSNYFDGTGDYISSSKTQTVPATGDFTVDGWFYLKTSSYSNFPSIFSQGTSGSAGRFSIYINNDGKLGIQITTSVATFGSAVTPFQWNYFAITRSGSTVTAYLNGSSIGTTTNSESIQNTTPLIGSEWNGDPYRWQGYLSNIRVSNTIRSISLPTAPFTSDGNTTLLACQSNRFIDTSGTPATLTPSGNTSVQPFSPFAPSAAYSTSVNGGSGYFDGTGDYLSVASNADFAYGTGDFTWEAWVYRTTTTDDSLYTTMITDGFIVHIISGNVIVRRFGVADLITSSATVSANTWTHIAVARSGTTLSLWINGSRSSGGTTTNSTNFAQNGVRIGINDIDTNLLNGYLSSLRSIKGTALYDPTQTTITIPTAPTTAVSGTELLLNFSNAGILDNTGKNNLETVADCAINTTTKKYGTGSMEFDGTGDALFMPSSPNIQIDASSDFTLECWVYTATSGLAPSISQNVGSTKLIAFFLRNSDATTIYAIASEGNYPVSGNSNLLRATTDISTNTWTHVAFVRSSGTITIYVNGTAAGTASNTYKSEPLRVIGAIAEGSGPSSLYFNGYIDDLRITKGVARYTTTFTPPDKAFPDL